MAAKYSTALRNYLLDGGSFKEAMADGTIKVYSGTEPASANDAVAGTMLYEVTAEGDGLALGAASAGSIGKDSGQAWGGSAAASGTPSYFRWTLPGDDGASSTTALRVQGKAGLISDPDVQLGLSSLTITSGAPQTIDSATVTIPAA